MSKYQAFQRFSYDIETAIQATVDDVALKCIANHIVSEALRPGFVDGSGNKTQKAKQLVGAVIDQIKVDESKFDEFVRILELDPTFKKLVCDLRCQVRETQPGCSASDDLERNNEDDYGSKAHPLQDLNPPTRSNAEDDQEEPFPTAVEHADEQASFVPSHSQTIKSFESKSSNEVSGQVCRVKKVDRKALNLECKERVVER